MARKLTVAEPSISVKQERSRVYDYIVKHGNPNPKENYDWVRPYGESMYHRHHEFMKKRKEVAV